MLEKIGKVSNPLTIIAIFAALAEVAGTVAISVVNDKLQFTFVWFVMLFPVLLVVLFFLTLNFNRKVLYGPSDFKNQEHFIHILLGHHKLARDLDDISNQVESVRNDILNETNQKNIKANVSESARLLESINEKMILLSEKTRITQESADRLTDEVVAHRAGSKGYSHTSPVDVIKNILKREIEGLSIYEIAQRTHFSPGKVHKILMSLVEQNVVKHYSIDKLRSVYRIVKD